MRQRYANENRCRANPQFSKITEIRLNRYDLRIGKLQGADQLKLDRDVRLYLQEKVARIFHPPLDIGHLETRGSLPTVADEFGVDRHDQIMIAAVQRKYPAQMHIAGAGKNHLSLH